MTRMLLTAATSSLLALAAPAVAQAQHGKHHHGARHASHKRHHHAAQAHVLSFGASAPAQSTTPTTTTTPSTPSNENAGTVKSFEKGVLTITLNDGTTVSGQVNESTQLECRSATPTETSGDDDQGGGDDSGEPSSGEHGGPSSQAHAADSHGDGSHGEEGGGHASDNGGQQSCTTAALVEKAVVREAELSVSSAGAVWEKVELVK
jgi:hypothetical protein